MSASFKWCKDKSRLTIWNKQVFCFEYGAKYWYLNGKPHRENGPAVEWYNGGKSWYLVGKLHRVNGPAVEYANGYKAWYFNGKLYSESVYWRKLKRLKK